MATTKLLISLPISSAANKYFGKDSKSYNKPGDSGVDLPNVYTYELPDSVHGHTTLVDYCTLFAMYDTKYSNSVISLQNLAYLCGSSNTVDENSAVAFLVRVLKPMAHMLAPRSSISKTPFRLANSIGIIDSTYKGLTSEKADTVKAALDFVPALYDDSKHRPQITEGERLVQIISPDLSPICHYKLDFCTDDFDFWRENISTTARGGFGSTS